MLSYVWHRMQNAVVGYLIFAIATFGAYGLIYFQNESQHSALCRESHQRYAAISGTINGAFTVSPVALQRVHGDQLAVLVAYDKELRTRLLGQLGKPPSC